MFKKILVPTDGSQLSEKAVDAALEFARELRAQVLALSIAEPYPFAPLAETAFSDEREAYEERARMLALERVEAVAAAAGRIGVPCDTLVAQSFAPHDEIVKAAERHQCDVIFMASHGRKGLSSLLIGSETQKVLANTKIPVMVYR